MEQIAGIGTTAVFLLAALVWVAYLVPVWLRQREYVATERNAVRLQQTLRIMAETADAPAEVQIAADAREIARQQRLVAKEARLRQAIERAEAVARAKELDEQIKAVERQVKVAVAGSVTRRERLRRTRLACTAMLVASVAVLVGAALLQAVLPVVLAAAVLLLALAGLVAVNRSSTQLRRVARAAEQAAPEVVRAEPATREPVREREVADFAPRSWTPVPVPPQLRSAQAPIDVLRDVARRSVVDSRPLAPVTPLPAATFDELVAGEGDTSEQDAVDAVRSIATASASLQAAATPAQVAESEGAEERVAPAAASESAYAGMGVVDETGDALDIGAALRRRRAG